MIRLASEEYPNQKTYLEITISNADKHSKKSSDYYQRLQVIEKYKYAVIFSNSGLFVDKLKFLNNCVFVLGNDTLVRVMDVEYYGDSEKDLKSIMDKFQQANCRFETFPRFDKAMERMLTIDEILKVNKFNKDVEDQIKGLIKEHKDFRMDISSTQIRTKQQSQWISKLCATQK